MNAKLAALFGAVLTATAMLAFYAPGAQSGSGNPKLKIKTVNESVGVTASTAGGPTATCPTGFHVTGGGYSYSTNPDSPVVFAGRQGARTYHVTIDNNAAETVSVVANAICVKGKNGLQIVDDATGLPG